MKKILLIVIFTFSAIIFLNAKGNSNPKIDAPANVTIVYSDSTVTIGWDAVPNTSKYYIYYQSEPYGIFMLVDSTETTAWNGNFTENKKFFQVSAKEIPPPAEMVFVQGGTFSMGDHFSEGNINELPVHDVTVSDFNIGTKEVTQKEWSDIMGTNPAHDYGVGDNYPVYYVSWYAIMKYCNLRSISEGINPCYTISSSTDPAVWGTVPTSSNSTWNSAICNWSANGYRLPSEAEWEYAARGGIHNSDNYHYSGSDTVGDVAWYFVNNNSYGAKTVGTKAPNQLGIYDMSGNEVEWCWDCYGAYSSTAQTNPTGPTTGNSRVLRGGYWYSNAVNCRVAYRYDSTPSYNFFGLGFRLARTP